MNDFSMISQGIRAQARAEFARDEASRIATSYTPTPVANIPAAIALREERIIKQTIARLSHQAR
jgi:hypothetical protein